MAVSRVAAGVIAGPGESAIADDEVGDHGRGRR
jgi:hypothetical protein